jgi:hypothetical protein
VTPARGKTPPGGKTPPAGGKTPPRGKTPPAGGKGAAVVEAGAAEADAWEEEVSSTRCTTSFTWVGSHTRLAQLAVRRRSRGWEVTLVSLNSLYDVVHVGGKSHLAHLAL